MRSKRALMGLAALLVVVFHFYIPFGRSIPETFFYKAAYLGVDLFFLVSGASLGKRLDYDIPAFYRNRLKNIYLPFVILNLIGAGYKHWSLSRILQILSGIEFFRRGGGAFLWYAIGILLLYLAVPFLARLKKSLGLASLPLMLAGWAILTGVLQFGLHYTDLFILLHRIPIFLLGFFRQELRELPLPGRSPSLKGRTLAAALCFLAGVLLAWKTGTLHKLNQPLQEFYYVAGIPLVYGLAELMESLYTVIPCRLLPLEWIGGFTLELYGLQMIFGYDLEKKLLKVTSHPQLSFLLTALALVLMAYAFARVRRLAEDHLTPIITGGKS